MASNILSRIVVFSLRRATAQGNFTHVDYAMSRNCPIWTDAGNQRFLWQNSQSIGDSCRWGNPTAATQVYSVPEARTQVNNAYVYKDAVFHDLYSFPVKTEVGQAS